MSEDDCCWRRWVRKALKCIRSDAAATCASVGMIHAKLDMIMKELRNMAANFEELKTDLQTLIAGYRSVVAENVILKQQLANADAATQQAVAEAVAADDVVDQAAVDAADEVVDAANAELNPPVDEG